MSAVMKESQLSRPVAQFIATAKKLLIDGRWLAAASERTFEVKNPANGATIARAAEGDKVDIDAAGRAARRRSSRDPSSPAGAARWAWRFSTTAWPPGR